MVAAPNYENWDRGSVFFETKRMKSLSNFNSFKISPICFSGPVGTKRNEHGSFICHYKFWDSPPQHWDHSCWYFVKGVFCSEFQLSLPNVCFPVIRIWIYIAECLPISRIFWVTCSMPHSPCVGETLQTKKTVIRSVIPQVESWECRVYTAK